MKRALIVVLFGTALALFLFSLSDLNEESKAPHSENTYRNEKVTTDYLPPIEESNSTPTKAIEPLVEAVVEDVPASGQQVLKKPDHLTDEEWQLVKVMHDEYTNADVSIVFYGQVVDQDKNPVEGAEVEVSVTYYDGFSLEKMMAVKDNYKERVLKFQTDTNGQFTVKNQKGRAIAIKISKEGYSQPSGKLRYVYDPGEISLRHKPDIKNPVIFSMWRKGETEELIKIEQLGVWTKPEQNKFSFNLTRGATREGNDSASDLNIELINEGRVGEAKRYNWSIVLSVPHGGIIANEEQFQNHAPEVGYQDTYRITMNSSADDWKNVLRDQRFYIKSRNGKIYSAVAMTIRAYPNKGGRVLIDFVTNPNSSNSLEYDPEKDVTSKWKNKKP